MRKQCFSIGGTRATGGTLSHLQTVIVALFSFKDVNRKTKIVLNILKRN